MIKVENLSMLFSTEEVQTKALNEVTFEIGKGEFVAIMGPSGCGKSTLLNILGTLDTPTSGSYLFEGKRVDKMNENQLIYVVDESGKFAVRRPIKIGRQNPQFYEVTDGLASGEKVIISGYELFGDNEKLILNE